MKGTAVHTHCDLAVAFNTSKIFKIMSWKKFYHSVNKTESESRSVVSDSLLPRGLSCSWNSPGQNTGVGSLFPSPGDLRNPGIEPRSPTLQADSLQAEPQGSPRILEWVAYPFSSRSSWPRNWTEVSCIASRDLTNWARREVEISIICHKMKMPQ